MMYYENGPRLATVRHGQRRAKARHYYGRQMEHHYYPFDFLRYREVL